MKSDRYYYPYPYGLEFLLVLLLGILGGVIFSTNTTNLSTQSASNNNSLPVTSNGKDPYYLLWKQEGGGCQNWVNDRQNRGGSAYTCLGIVQGTWEQYLRGTGAGQGLPSTTKAAYDQLGEEGFKRHAKIIYDKYYCKPIDCQSLPSPVAEVSIAISANGGVGTARRWLFQTKDISNPKERALKIAELEHARLDRIANKNPSQRAFRRGGWQQNIDNRYEYINKF